MGFDIFSARRTGMPIFEYRCVECGSLFEKIVNAPDERVHCKKCQSLRVEKMLSVFAVVNASRSASLLEPGPCGACGAPRRGMCGE
jgi:putative FmdB family regulatory protein